MEMRTELNGKEKLAQVVNGMESTGTPVVVNGKSADIIQWLQIMLLNTI